MPTPQIAVFTGDIVASSRLSEGELGRVMARLSAAAEQVESWTKPAQVNVFERFRGDGWQAVASEPAQALRACLFFRATVRGLGPALDTRISVGIGGGRVAPGRPLGAASGAAFEASGRGLDAIARPRRFAVDWERPPGCAPVAVSVFVLSDAVSARWTAKQAEVFRLMLSPSACTQSVVADRLGISQQMVAKHLASGGEWALQQAIRAFEDADGVSNNL
jgi:hypothetical protein